MGMCGFEREYFSFIEKRELDHILTEKSCIIPTQCFFRYKSVLPSSFTHEKKRRKKKEKRRKKKER